MYQPSQNRCGGSISHQSAVTKRNTHWKTVPVSLKDEGRQTPSLEPGDNSVKISHGFQTYAIDMGIQVQRSLYFHALLEAYNSME